jgi:hypothetical protein
MVPLNPANEGLEEASVGRVYGPELALPPPPHPIADKLKTSKQKKHNRDSILFLTPTIAIPPEEYLWISCLIPENKKASEGTFLFKVTSTCVR